MSRENDDQFFQQVIPMMAVNRDSVQCYKSALQWYTHKIKYIEARLELSEHSFKVDSHKVQKGLNQYANAYLIFYQTTNQDAHQGLPTCILSIDEHHGVIHHLMQEKFRCWNDMASPGTCNKQHSFDKTHAINGACPTSVLTPFMVPWMNAGTRQC